MKIIIKENYEQMSRAAAGDLLELMHDSHQTKLVCPASGDTPSGLLSELVSRFQQGDTGISQWKFIGLDEWAGMNGDTPGSCRDYLNRQLFIPCSISESNIFFFDGKAENLEKQCSSAELFIKENKGIHVCILGLGLNGHIGMNEPGTPSTSRSHVAEIASETQQIGQKYFTNHQSLTHGLTLGIATIMEAEHIFLVVSGKKKASIVKQVIEGPVTEAVPATLLRTHKDFRIYLDKEAVL